MNVFPYILAVRADLCEQTEDLLYSRRVPDYVVDIGKPKASVGGIRVSLGEASCHFRPSRWRL